MILYLVFLFTTFALSCVGGWFFSQYYFRTSRMASVVKFADQGAQRLFCVIFGACCNTLLLIIFELLDFMTYSFRLAALKTHIAALLLFMLYQAYGMFRHVLSRRHATAATTASQLVLIYTLQRLLPAWPGVPEPPAGGLFSLRVAVLRTGVLGVCFIAILAGFGTVAFPYSVLRAFVVPVDPQEIKALQTQLQLVREQIEDKLSRARLLDEQAYRARQAHSGTAGGGNGGGWWGGAVSRLSSGFTGGGNGGGGDLRESAAALQVMEATLAGDVSELVAEREREMAASTLLGRLMNVLGYVLAAYCVVKMLLCAKAALFGEDFSSDPASRALALLLRVTSGGAVHIDTQAAGQYVTLVFVGFVSFNSLRAFLKQLHRVFAAISGLFGASADAAAPAGAGRASAAAERMLLLLGALLCAYTVSSVMLMRAQLPVAHRSLVTTALGLEDSEGDSEFDAVHRWFNGVQLVSLAVSLVLCYANWKNKQANVLDSVGSAASSDAAGFAGV
eukprot:jgi/Ulvmu1/636/UM010_0006.1